ncbi:MAG: peroxiredoxin, partial [Cyanobium sp.]
MNTPPSAAASGATSLWLSRRDFFRAVGFLGCFALAAQPAQALGGTLPGLDQPAPGFDLEGVAPSLPSSPTAANADAAIQATRLALADFRGRWLVLYFYPRDFTSGCTLEARGFQRDLAAFHAQGAEVVGISADSPSDHAAFCGSE